MTNGFDLPIANHNISSFIQNGLYEFFNISTKVLVISVGVYDNIRSKFEGLAYSKDETPIPKKYVSYELPDSDANILSAGVRIKYNDSVSWGIAYLHDQKDSFTLKAGENANGIIGKFSGGGADLLTAGMSYNF